MYRSALQPLTRISPLHNEPAGQLADSPSAKRQAAVMEVLRQVKVQLPLPDGTPVDLTLIATLNAPPRGVLPDFISTYIWETRKFFEESVVFDIVAHLKPGMMFVDVGANLGTFTAAARAVGAETISIEPQPVLQETLRANAGEGKVFSVGAGTSTEKLRVYTAFMRHPRSGGIMANLGGNGMVNEGGRQPSDVEVEIRRLDDLLEGVKPDIIKIDVEGMEQDVLISGTETLEKYKPLLYLEQNKGHELNACFKVLKPLGYRVDEVLGDELSSTVVRYAAD